MARYNLPDHAVYAPISSSNYSSEIQTLNPMIPLDGAWLDSLVGPFAAMFDYAARPSGNTVALIEGLLRIEACSAALETWIAPLWRELEASSLTVAEDVNKQRVDRLFGLNGYAGLLGTLKRYRRLAAEAMPAMAGAAQAEFLAEFVTFSETLLPVAAEEGDGAAANLWAWNAPDGTAEPSAAPALPVYLQTLSLLVLLQGWIGGVPGTAEQAVLARHRAFLTGGDDAAFSIAGSLLAGRDGPAAAAVRAAARALTA